MEPRIRWWKLKEKEVENFKEKLIQEASWSVDDDIETMWFKMSSVIKSSAKEVLAEVRGRAPVGKEAW